MSYSDATAAAYGSCCVCQQVSSRSADSGLPASAAAMLLTESPVYNLSTTLPTPRTSVSLEFGSGAPVIPLRDETADSVSFSVPFSPNRLPLPDARRLAARPDRVRTRILQELGRLPLSTVLLPFRLLEPTLGSAGAPSTRSFHLVTSCRRGFRITSSNVTPSRETRMLRSARRRKLVASQGQGRVSVATGNLQTRAVRSSAFL